MLENEAFPFRTARSVAIGLGRVLVGEQVLPFRCCFCCSADADADADADAVADAAV